MSLQLDSDHPEPEHAAVPFAFSGKLPSSHGPETVVNPERKGILPSDSRELTPAALVKRRRLFPTDDLGSDEIPDGSTPTGPAGVELAHFLVEEPIGRGGMGAVYRAIDTRLQRVVALKVLSPDQSTTQNSVQRFVNEARASARLDHDNIARVYFVGEDDGLHFIAYEYVTGTNVRDLIQQTGRLDPAEAINYTLQVAAALKHTSAAGVVHRDVKPSNIIVTPVGRAKLVDLGLARKEYSESVDELTVAGTTLGTFDYISPEQARDPRNVDVRSDIYSLGCTLYQMLTGEPPYPEGTMYQKLLRHDGKEPPDPAKKNGRVPSELSAIVRKMMASDPARRYRDADELIRDLMTVAGRMGIRTVSPDGLVWAAEMTQRPAAFWRRHLGWISTAAALVLIVFLLDRYQDRINLEVNPPPVADSQSPEGNRSTLVTQNNQDASPTTGTAQSAGNGGSDQESSGEGPADGAAGDNEGGSAFPPTELTDSSRTSPTRQPKTGAAGTETTPDPEPGEGNTPSTPDNAVAVNTAKPADVNPPVPSPVPPEPDETPTTADGEETTPAAPVAVPPAAEKKPQISLLSSGNSGGKSFNTLEAACVAAEDSSVILLRYNGTRAEAERKPLRVNNKRIEIRGDEGYRPVIEFRPVETAGDLPTRLVTLLGGVRTSVELINVDIRVVLPESADSSLDWALFSLRGAERVRLNDVRVTFVNPGGRFTARVFELTSAPSGNLTDMNKMMSDKQTGAPAEFEIKLIDSFIRGGCDLFHVANTRPGNFSIEHSAIAIDGTLLSAVGDLDMPQDNTYLELEMENVTGLLGNGLIRMNSGGDPRQLLPVQVTSRKNIFSTNADRPLVMMSGNTDPDDFRELLTWTGQRNFYDRYFKFWLISSDLETISPMSLEFDQWKSYWGGGSEFDPHHEPVIWKNDWWQKDFASLTVDDLMLDRSRPDNPAAGVLNGIDAGADLQKLHRAPVNDQQSSQSDLSGGTASLKAAAPSN